MDQSLPISLNCFTSRNLFLNSSRQILFVQCKNDLKMKLHFNSAITQLARSSHKFVFWLLQHQRPRILSRPLITHPKPYSFTLKVSQNPFVK